jgi:hypothetical protein
VAGFLCGSDGVFEKEVVTGGIRVEPESGEGRLGKGIG